MRSSAVRGGGSILSVYRYSKKLRNAEYVQSAISIEAAEEALELLDMNMKLNPCHSQLHVAK